MVELEDKSIVEENQKHLNTSYVMVELADITILYPASGTFKYILCYG